MTHTATVTIRVAYDPECETHPARWAWGEIIGNDAVIVDAADTREPCPECGGPLQPHPDDPEHAACAECGLSWCVDDADAGT